MKIIKNFIFLTLLTATSFAFGQEHNTTDTAFYTKEFNSLLVNMDNNICTIPVLLQNPKNMSMGERLRLYEKYKKNPLIPSILNATVGFGIGDLAMSDMGHFAISASTQALMILTFTIGVMVHNIADRRAYLYGEDPYPFQVVGNLVIGFSGLGFFYSRVFDSVIPYAYTEEYNFKLRKLLGLTYSYDTSFHFKPVLQISDANKFRIGMESSLRF